jgi:hypothetical protein
MIQLLSRPRSRGARTRPARAGAVAALLLLLSGADRGAGDDRNLFRAQGANPSVMMLLDVSDSMTWRLTR